jgi:predicted membrane protein
MESVSNKRIFTGAIFLIIGVLLTLDNLDILNIELPDYLFGWYTILIIIGLFITFVRERVGLGVTLIIIGGLFMFDEMAYYFYWDFDFKDVFKLWPLVLVAIGASLIFRKSQEDKVYEKKNNENTTDWIDEMAIFSGSEKTITSKEFKGGKLTSIFGGTEIDLFNADLAQGTNILDVFVLFGGTDIRVPPDMNVTIKATAIFGGFSDERKIITENESNEGKELVIKGLVLFGGGEVK